MIETGVAEFGRVAVMYGGFSSEREVSLAIRRGGVVRTAIDGVSMPYGWDPAEKRPVTELAAAGFQSCVDRIAWPRR